MYKDKKFSVLIALLMELDRDWKLEKVVLKILVLELLKFLKIIVKKSLKI